MSYLPNPQTLALLVSNVTQTMCGFSFGVVDAARIAQVDCWRMAVLDVTGGRPWRVAIFSDRAGCVALGAGLCQRSPETLEDSMIEDALCELLNMSAGQIKILLAADERLGLPRITSPAALSPQAHAAYREGILLRSQDSVNLMMWISEGLG